jgi:hypothetical protein
VDQCTAKGFEIMIKTLGLFRYSSMAKPPNYCHAIAELLEEGVHYIQKPFSMQDLAVKVREAIEQE